MKRCFRCGEVKAIDEFYRHPMMTDGHLGKCKECTKIDVRGNYRIRLSDKHAYDKARTKTTERRLSRLAQHIRWAERHPEKERAHRKVHNALRDGRLVRLPCEMCGETKTQAHHDDYAKPLEVRWLCFRCHRGVVHGSLVDVQSERARPHSPLASRIPPP
jgi:hypothetical protein